MDNHEKLDRIIKVLERVLLLGYFLLAISITLNKIEVSRLLFLLSPLPFIALKTFSIWRSKGQSYFLLMGLVLIHVYLFSTYFPK
jgi:hypothetical protein